MCVEVREGGAGTGGDSGRLGGGLVKHEMATSSFMFKASGFMSASPLRHRTCADNSFSPGSVHCFLHNRSKQTFPPLKKKVSKIDNSRKSV